ncbi:hypothetical protein E2C01_014333 [Portunus trituberculatus]|uniref:Uncharacterized protein n=1 Tax=Portunus trituberculatus TaxID=210409 RepID=A0A5B7DIW9_PORTR|nr:hypothetical protein [Portunus trituberculatus]
MGVRENITLLLKRPSSPTPCHTPQPTSLYPVSSHPPPCPLPRLAASMNACAYPSVPPLSSPLAPLSPHSLPSNLSEPDLFVCPCLSPSLLASRRLVSPYAMHKASRAAQHTRPLQTRSHSCTPSSLTASSSSSSSYSSFSQHRLKFPDHIPSIRYSYSA